ncbi:MAG: pilus assembly protein [Gammaproteobacteria bacterium]
MKTINTSRYLSAIGGLILVLGSAPASYADDTELFFTDLPENLEELNAAPNILFIIDTSGSMDGEVQTQPDWDPDTTWAGAYDSDAIYWSRWGNVPDPSTEQWFHKSAQHCDAANAPLRGVGVYQGNVAAWKDSGSVGANFTWREPYPGYHNRPLECEDDSGVHGEGIDGAEVDPSKPYIADGVEFGPWSDTPNFVWNDEYTLYDGNHLNWKNTTLRVTKTRLEVTQSVVNNLLDTLVGVNVGMMRFNQKEGGPIVHEVAPIDANRSTLKAAVNAFDHDGWTPLSETLYEAGRYFSGQAPYYGNCTNVTDGTCIDSVATAQSGGTYDSPINFSCQENYVVLLTDGKPTEDVGANSAIPALPGFVTATGSASCDRGDLTDDNGKCLDEMATYMHNHDISPLDGTQTVTTHTVGFGVDLNVLRTTASGGGGEYQPADDTSSLSIALTEIILDIFDDTTTFTSPSVPVNSFNRMQNLQDVFVSVFEPSGLMHWPGNLKKYRLVNGQFTDQTGALAIDPDTGFFRTDPPAHSYWSDSADGDNAKAGGAAHEIGAWASRNLYSNLGGTLNVPLTAGSNEVTVASTVSAAQLGIADVSNSALRQEVIEWARGRDVWDVDDDNAVDDDRHQMGAPLHVRPVTIIYGGTADNPDAVIHTMTNDGYMHAINTRDGSEEWAFIPNRLLDRLYGLYVNGESGSTSYGLDGDIVAYIKDDDFVPGISPGVETAYLLFGQRRGGDAVFALDVTLRGQPKLAWVIDSTSHPALADLGQTWSTPTVMKVNIGGVTKHTAIIGGGYAEPQDASGYREDTVGNALYMIDIETGQVLWSAGANGNHNLVMNDAVNADANATMKHSIPAPIQALDLTGDGYVNRMYAADMGGRIWRFDVNNGAAADDLVEGGLLATLGGADLGTPTNSDARRFYARPDAVPYIAEKPGDRSYLSLNIGSGHRAHPLDGTSDDWFFSVRDYELFNPILTENYGTPVKFDDLIDITDDLSPTLYATDPGWRLKLEASAGEKVFTESLTFKGTTIFTSFSPSPPSSSCTEAVHGTGTNRLYRVSVVNGTPDVQNLNDPVDKTDRYRVLKQGGIAPGPVIFFTNHDNDGDEEPGQEGIPDGKTEADCFVGTESGGCGFTDDFVPTYWFQDETR